MTFVSHHPGWDEQLMMELPTSSLTHQDKHLFTSPQESHTTDNPSYLKDKINQTCKQSRVYTNLLTSIKGDQFYFSFFCCFVLKYNVCALSACVSIYQAHVCLMSLEAIRKTGVRNSCELPTMWMIKIKPKFCGKADSTQPETSLQSSFNLYT